jgi:hypothetical protein
VSVIDEGSRSSTSPPDARVCVSGV